MMLNLAFLVNLSIRSPSQPKGDQISGGFPTSKCLGL